MGRLVVITSGKGGAGKTSVTAGIGAALVARARRVLLVDACAGARCLDMYTGLAGEVLYDLGDVLTGRCTPSMAIHTVGSGLDLLAGPQRQEDFCDKGQIASLYQVLTQHYDFVLVD